MLCPSCHGRHWIATANQVVPCGECGGIGVVHCCDGLRPNCEAGVPGESSARNATGRTEDMKHDYAFSADE
jgi:hypothetical protein